MRLISIIQGTEEVIADFEGIANRVEHDEKGMKAIGLIGLRRSQLSFQEQGWDGSRWAELAKSTIDHRRNKDSSSIQILRDTGELMQSIAEEGEFSVWQVEDHFVKWGSNRPGADAHQDGTNSAGKDYNVHIPRRQYLGWTAIDLSDYQTAYLDAALGFGEE